MHFYVVAHRGSEGVIEKCLPFWKRFSTAITFICPDNAMVDGFKEIKKIGVAGSSWQGPDNIHRVIAALKFAAHGEEEAVAILEYDCVMLDKLPLEKGCVSGPYMYDPDTEQPPNRKFKGSGFIHSPWVMTRETANELYKKTDEVFHDSIEDGFPDRWFLYLVEKSGIPIRNYLAKGAVICFTKDRNCPKWEREDVQGAKQRGIYIFHGFKKRDEIAWILEEK